MNEGFHATKNGSPSRPFVKWAGGKSQLLEQLSRLLPDDLARHPHLTYVEPFVGGGAMLFYMLGRFPNIEHAVVNDLNGDLIVTYKMVKERVHELIAALAELQREYHACPNEKIRKAMYLAKRDEYNQRGTGDIKTAALFIFLNRTCFNGLHRVNSKGRFNVPFGKAENPLICDPSTLLADSAALQKVEILHGDFASVEKHVTDKAFFYFDPPYRPLTPSSFTAYDKGGFGDDQQMRLAKFCRRLDEKGHRWLLSNSDPRNVNPGDRFFENIYAGFEIRRVSASRMINSKVDGRGKITELAIRNYATANRRETFDVFPPVSNIREQEVDTPVFRYGMAQVK